ncbi:MAG: F0F1 ATP synthase subunit gamma [Gammaproteobacteria bacterium]|jgi:F-type H+-transporting ATPase subunit gamma
MESLEKLHGQLDSLEDLRTIVKTMKALSAASIRQYERAVISLGVFYRTVERGLYVVLKDLQHPPTPRLRTNDSRRLAAIVFGSDHGLCGRFNEEITGYALQRMDSVPADAKTRLILAVGARAAAALEQQGQAIEEDFLVPGSAFQITATVQQILLKVDEWREQADVHYVYLFYNRHSGRKGYNPTGFELLPINLKRFHRLEEQTWPSRSLPTFTMDRESLLQRLLNQYLFVSLFRACAESQASEHASRLAAMQSAQRNLDERLEEVTMVFRRARQNAITAELLDVVAGFEATTAEGWE